MQIPFVPGNMILSVGRSKIGFSLKSHSAFYNYDITDLDEIITWYKLPKLNDKH